MSLPINAQNILPATAIPGQVIVWNGSAWVAGNNATGTEYFAPVVSKKPKSSGPASFLGINAPTAVVAGTIAIPNIVMNLSNPDPAKMMQGVPFGCWHLYISGATDPGIVFVPTIQIDAGPIINMGAITPEVTVGRSETYHMAASYDVVTIAISGSATITWGGNLTFAGAAAGLNLQGAAEFAWLGASTN